MRRFILMAFILLMSIGIHANDQKLNPILEDAYVTGGVAWANDEQKLIVPALYISPQIILKTNSDWITRTLIKYGKYFAWSNNGDQYAFWDEGKIYVNSLSANKPVLIGPGDDSAISWSPDGNWLAYTLDKYIWIVSSDLKTKRKVNQIPVKRAAEPQWLNKNEIVFSGINKDEKKIEFTIWRVNIDTGETTKINENLNCILAKGPIWRDKIVVIGFTTHDIMLLGLDGSVNSLISDKHFIRYDENGLYYKSKRNLIRIKDNISKIIMKEVDHVSISPSGKYVAYAVMDKFYIEEFSKYEFYKTL